MRLNVGSGKQYLPGYTNVDLFEPDLADISAPAHSLTFTRDGSVSELVSYHLLEHLGLINTYRTLAHWAIKLKPGGRLALETPELLPSLRSLLKSKSLGELDWVFGVSDIGQSHQRPFFTDELVKILKLIGFVNIKIKEPLGFWKHNTVRLEAKMGKSIQNATVLESWCQLDLSQGAFYALPFELLRCKINEYTLAKMACKAPKIALLTLSAIDTISNKKESKIKRFERSKTNTWKKVLNKLDRQDFPGKLFRMLMCFERKPKGQKAAVKEIISRAEKMVFRSLKNGKLSQRIYNEIDLPVKKENILNHYHKLTWFFCQHNISELSVYECAHGIKAFSNKDHKKALDHFRTSVDIDSENTIAWWNLAREEWINNNRANATKPYENAYELSKDSVILTEMQRSVPVKIPKEIAYASEI